MNIKSLDIFCDVIDNFGDIGVVYRVAKEMKKIHGENIEIRVILNRLDEFLYLNRRAKKIEYQEIDGITYLTEDFLAKNICTFSPANVIIEAFGCNIFSEYLEKAKSESSLLINLEYLSGEKWIEDVHGMESLMGAKKLKKFFFMPGFSEKTGGVIVDSLFLDRKKMVQENREMYLKKYITDLNCNDKFIGTVFSYEKNFLPLLNGLENNLKNNILLIMGEKSQNSLLELQENLNLEKLSNDLYRYKNIELKFMPFLEQEEYEELINAVDYNLVRGEDSFVRALLTGKPFIWHIYLQDEMAHMDKIEGFIDRYMETMSKLESEKIIEVHTKLLRDYNLRDKNSLEIGKEDFIEFFEKFDDIKKLSERYSEYLISNCNLIEKLNRFILKY